MGFCVNQRDPETNPQENDQESKTRLKRMVLDLGFGCFLLPRTSSREDNKAWLLEETEPIPKLIDSEPHSLQSSFRFSLFSLVELEKTKKEHPSSSYRDLPVSEGSDTVLFVNLENETGESKDDMNWSRDVSLEKSISPVTNTLVRFSYSELLAATRSFSKRFCIDPDQGLFLVYKYVSGGSLERFLHDKKKKKGRKSPLCLPWSTRYKVALGIAEAIAYLHNGTEQCVVHRDIKPSNILLSSNKIPKLCDFGLATWTAAPSVPFLCKTVKGTFGYLAPEYFQHGKISDKTDVYAFGVVLLELITGRKPIEARRPSGEENLVVWAKPLLHRGIEAIEELLDPRLKCTRKNTASMERMIRAAAACVINEESRRPGMEEILSILKGSEGIELRTFSSRKKSNLPGIMDCYPQFQRTKSEMKSHLALAMLGVPEFEEDDLL
ncbi:PREDICTED: receptor-like serine/threonine-protein kinase At1g78530 isoform X2 [Camelina sativa]|uniref:Receptor-like serine/threonine-protein kinase At1g78530 isoform X2 n=1 Tax=Camelina sativa TaxID=90675 RepID=A0ABM0Z7E7_CAMSA|nr:PREDICTED: receptor-like serine/threonine-protein kinase At1g78530 isoform X2 [Camelina sativa]